jgi:phosphoribosylformimino-5-aminoimidazole carboxamide ribotide isomerase
MEVIPAIDLIGGKCVRLTRGDYGQETVYAEDPVEQAMKFYALGARTLHLIDLDGAKQGKSAHLSVIDALRKVSELNGMKIEFGGGVRTIESVRIAINKGVDTVIVGTAAYRDPKLLEEMMKEMPESVAIAVDVRKGNIVVEGWLSDAGAGTNESIVENLGERGVRKIIFTDTERDGTLEGVDVKGLVLGRVMARCEEKQMEMQYAGGVRDENDIMRLMEYESSERKLRLERTGKEFDVLTGIVTGKAVYEGTLDLARAVKLARGEAPN